MNNKPAQKDPLPFALNLVNFDQQYGEVPESERVNKEKTLALRKKLSEDGKLPKLATSIHQQLAPSLVIPNEEEIKVLSEARSDQFYVLCGECLNFNYQAGQEFLGDQGGAMAIQESLGGEKEGSWLGDWRKYGWCEALNCPCDSQATKCDFFEEKKKGVFGRILSGTWKRIREI